MIEILVGYVISGVICGFMCSLLAKQKGYGRGYFLVGLFFNIIGLFYVGFLPTFPRTVDEHRLALHVARAIRMTDEQLNKSIEKYLDTDNID